MLVSCLCRVRQRDFTQLHALSVSMCIYVYAYMYAIGTRYVCGSASTSLSRQRALPRTVCMRQRGHFTFPLSRQRGTFSLSRTTCMRQRGHFHFQGSAAAPGHVGGDGLPDCTRVRVCWSLFEFVGVCVRVCVELGGPCPAQPRQSCQPLCQPLCQSLCRFLSTACAHTPTREVALVALGFLSGAGGALATSWRGGDDLPRPGHGALVALSSWPVAVFSARFSWRCLR